MVVPVVSVPTVVLDAIGAVVELINSVELINFCKNFNIVHNLVAKVLNQEFASDL